MQQPRPVVVGERGDIAGNSGQGVGRSPGLSPNRTKKHHKWGERLPDCEIAAVGLSLRSGIFTPCGELTPQPPTERQE